jgi:hypothetical protein
MWQLREMRGSILQKDINEIYQMIYENHNYVDHCTVPKHRM